MEDRSFKDILGNTYVIYYKSKIALSEAHLFRNPKDFTQKFDIEIPFKCDLDVLSYLIGQQSAVYGVLARKSWILYVIEITKILSYKEAFGIGKLHNKIRDRHLKTDIATDCFKSVLDLIDQKQPDSVVEKLKFLRDKYYAHRDGEVDRLSNELFPTFQHVWELMDLLDRFFIAIYSQLDAHIDLIVNRHLDKYLREFKRTYQYFKTVKDETETWFIRRQFGDEKFTHYMSSTES